MNKRIVKLSSIVSGFAAAVLVAGLAVFAPTTATAGDGEAYGNNADAGTILGGKSEVLAGQHFDAELFSDPNSIVVLTVTIPGAGIPNIQVLGTASQAATTDAAGTAAFRVTIPSGTPAGTVYLVGNNAAGAVIYTASLSIPGAGAAPAAPNVVHPAAG